MSKQNEQFEDEVVIDFGALYQALMAKLYIIILVAILFAGAAFAASKYFMTPKYDSMTQVVIISKRSNTDMITYSDLQIGTVLTGDYAALVKSRTILEEVIREENLNMSVGALRSSITVEAIEDTRMVRIYVRNADPELARDIADALREAVEDEFKAITSLDSIHTVDKANLPSAPSTPNIFKNTVLGGAFGAALVIVIVVILFLLDDTIESTEDVEKYLDLSVLATLPMEEEANTKKEKKATKKDEK